MCRVLDYCVYRLCLDVGYYLLLFYFYYSCVVNWLYCFGVFFLFKHMPAYDVRISDWSSDVCSSDLEHASSTFTLLTMGWHCLAADVDDRLIFKFPRHETAEKALVAEANLLAVIRPAVTMPVPELVLHRGPPLFSRHVKLAGEHLLTRHYERLPAAARQRLAADMALLQAQLHRPDANDGEASGAEPLRPWLEPGEIPGRAGPTPPAPARR